MLAADTFHTFAEWKRMGYSVKKGQHAALVCNLWKYTDKPGKAAKEAAAAAGQDAPETDPHFYVAKSHLFNALQVEKSKRGPSRRTPSRAAPDKATRPQPDTGPHKEKNR